MKKLLITTLATLMLSSNANALTVTINDIEFDFNDIDYSELYTAISAVKASDSTSVLRELGVTNIQIADWNNKHVIRFTNGSDHTDITTPDNDNKIKSFGWALDKYLADINSIGKQDLMLLVLEHYTTLEAVSQLNSQMMIQLFTNLVSMIGI